MAKKKNELVKAPAKPPVKRGEDVPAWVTEGTEGFEGTTAQDLILPRLMLCQALSPQRQKKDPAFIPDLTEGDFFNLVTKEIYGPGPHKVTPILCAKLRIKYVDAKKIGSGIDCMGIPTPLSKENPEGIACRLNNGGACLHPGLDDEDPCFLIYNFPVLMHEHPEIGPVVLSFRSTGVKVARGWLSMMRMRGTYPMQSMAFTIESVDSSNQKGNFKSVKIDNAGWASKDFFESAQGVYQSIRNRVVLTDESDTQEREPGEDDEM